MKMLLNPCNLLSLINEESSVNIKEKTLTNFSTDYDGNISNMKINLWYCKEMKQWRWTLIDSTRPVCRQESGQRPFLRQAMDDIANTVEYMLETNQFE